MTDLEKELTAVIDVLIKEKLNLKSLLLIYEKRIAVLEERLALNKIMEKE